MRDVKSKRRELTAAGPAVVTGPLYEPLDFVLVRAPLLPVEAYLGLSAQPGQDGETDGPGTLTPWPAGARALGDPRIRRALAVGSQALLAAVERAEHSKLSPRDAARLNAKLLRYLVRMSTRPTPFGLFAGVALGRWGPSTDLSIEKTAAHATRYGLATVVCL
jgi:hypothetical protein